MMSNSNEETRMQVQQSTPSKVKQTTASTPNTDTTTVTSPSTDDLYTDAFNFALYKNFSSTLMASLTTKDAILKEIRDYILTENEDRCKQILPYIYSFWKDLRVKNGCVCIDERIAIPNSIKDAYLEAIHATHPGSWGMTDMATYAWWPYMRRDIVTKTAKCNPCVKIDLETFRWDELISEENWDVEARSDTELEHNRDKVSKDAARRRNADPDKESRMISHLAVKLAKKKPKTISSTKSLDGLYGVLAPDSSVVKTDTYTSAIKEPGERYVTIRNSDLAEFGTKAERQTELRMYPSRRPKIPSGRTTEEFINHHAKEARKKLEGDKRMNYRKIADDASAVSSIHSNVTRALRVLMPTKPKRTVITAPPQPPTEDKCDLAPPMELPLTSIVIAEPPTRQ